jgi:hypothetical protein
MYLGSNMHVLAPGYLRRGFLSYDVRNGDNPLQIALFNSQIESTATLVTAVFGGIDFGFARIDHPRIPSVVERSIPQVGSLKGILRLNTSNYRNVLPAFYGSTSGYRECSIRGIGAIVHTRFPNVFLDNLIMLNRCTQDGDSGAPLFDDQNRLLGFIVGRDEEASYALHISDILEFFQSSNL